MRLPSRCSAQEVDEKTGGRCGIIHVRQHFKQRKGLADLPDVLRSHLCGLSTKGLRPRTGTHGCASSHRLIRPGRWRGQRSYLTSRWVRGKRSQIEGLALPLRTGRSGERSPLLERLELAVLAVAGVRQILQCLGWPTVGPLTEGARARRSRRILWWGHWVWPRSPWKLPRRIFAALSPTRNGVQQSRTWCRKNHRRRGRC